jgi:OmpA-OmpF porin, OOP family
MIRTFCLMFCFFCALLLGTGPNLMAQRLRLGEHHVAEHDVTAITAHSGPWIHINTAFQETRPFISPSGKKLFFTRSGDPENIGGRSDEMDIWMADFSADSLNPSVSNLGPTVNTKRVDAFIGMSPDEQNLYAYSHHENEPITHFQWIDGHWKPLSKVKIKDFYNLGEYVDLFYSTVPEVILMAVQRRESIGGQDIYVSFKNTNSEWGAPVSLGPGINTSGNDFAPFLASDGRSLFYCSEGLTYKGGNDIYYAYRLDNTWNRWTAPINLGQPINSKSEVYVSVTRDFKSIYFDSNSPQDSSRNITVAELPEIFRPQNNAKLYPLPVSDSTGVTPILVEPDIPKKKSAPFLRSGKKSKQSDAPIEAKPEEPN